MSLRYVHYVYGIYLNPEPDMWADSVRIEMRAIFQKINNCIIYCNDIITYESRLVPKL